MGLFKALTHPQLTMDKAKLDLLIQEAAKQQQRELSWIGNVYQQRLKELQETNEKMKDWEAGDKD